MPKYLQIILPIIVVISIYLSTTAIIQTNQIQKQLISYRDNIILEQRIKQAENNIAAIANYLNQLNKPADSQPK